jgi:hypothetical protein
MTTVYLVEIINIETRKVESRHDNVDWEWIRDVINNLHPTEAVSINPKLEETA